MFNHPLLEYLSDKRFVLASTSPRRLEIVNQMGFNVEVVASNFVEDLDKKSYTPDEYVIATLKGKLFAVRDELSKDIDNLPEVILSADTVVECDGIIYEKPKSVEENIQNIKHLRDIQKPQRVLTGLIILHRQDNTYKVYEHTEVTYIDMDPQISDALIEMYCRSGDGMDVAGGYKIQSFGSLFMTGVRGDYYNVVGLPYRLTFNLLSVLCNCTV